MKKAFITILILIIILAIFLSFKIYKEKVSINTVLDTKKKATSVEEKNIQIYNGKQRPIAVMIDNVGNARPQAGLNDAYMVYEIIVEGNLTRLMALYKNIDIERIGPVRSSRHYFLDYALENDAIYVHYGWSPQAKSDISYLKVDNINGINESSKSFWRVKDKASPHNIVTSTDKILDIAKRKNYKTTSNRKSVLKYSAEEVELNNAISATSIKIPYSTKYNVSYKYNNETKKYTRICNENTQKDWQTKEIISTKNIIITFAKNSMINDGSGKGRQDLSNIGTLDGYYITNGKAIKIKCYKTSRKSQTVYKDIEGNEINVNDGNTFVQIVPTNCKVSIE